MRYFYSLKVVVLWCILFGSFAVSAQQEGESEDITALLGLSLEELIDVTVVSASNKDEKLSTAPATIIVITEDDIKQRGYFELYDVLNDLPGIDLSRAYGDDNYYAYVRGYRKTTSDQMLLMVDGIIMNHLYNNNMNAYAQYPLQNIKQIEIVYGPASAIYGPNAFTGVINMISKKNRGGTIQTTIGDNNTNIIDMYVSERIDSIQLSITGRFFQSNGPDLEGRTPMLQNDLYTNPYYWGDFAQTDFKGYQSPMESNYIHPSISFKGLTVGAISFFHESGLGAEFAGGVVLNAGAWQFKENTIYSKYEKSIGKLKSKTLLRYRRSDIPGSSLFLYRGIAYGTDTINVALGNAMTQYGLNLPNTTTSDQVYIVDENTQYVQHWQAINASYSFFQDFTYDIQSDLVVNFGWKYDRRMLNRDYIINGSEITRPIVYRQEDYSLDADGSAALNVPTLGLISFPDRPDDSAINQENNNTVTDRGVYAQVKYEANDRITLFGGLRYDYNSVWQEVLSPRLGVVYEPTEGLVTKAFFGTAFLEPSARILYGGWQGSLSNDQLVPEKMRTFELSANYLKDQFSVGMNAFYNLAPDAIGQVRTSAGRVPINLGERKMVGVEMNAKYLVNNAGSTLSKFRADAYLSYISSQEDLGDTGEFNETGNMAPIKLKLILTAAIKENLSISFQNRYTSEINTVDTNPFNTIDAFFVSDVFVNYTGFPTDQFSVGLKVYNWLNTDYFHPGYRDADAGESSVNNALLNSSWYNSRLPQAGRTLLINLRYSF